MPIDGRKTLALDIWHATASRLRSNGDFQRNPWTLAMCLTPGMALGRRAWPNLVVEEAFYEIPLLLSSNSFLVMTIYWLMGTREQQGRVSVYISKLPALNVRRLYISGHEACRHLFEGPIHRKMLPANETWSDKARKELDWRLLTEFIELDPQQLPRTDFQLREDLSQMRTWQCSEPSVYGGEDTRPP